jgi:hypothetical protein
MRREFDADLIGGWIAMVHAIRRIPRLTGSSFLDAQPTGRVLRGWGRDGRRAPSMTCIPFCSTVFLLRLQQSHA